MKKAGYVEAGEYHCACGNEAFKDGFMPCDEQGNEIEPTIESGWTGYYVCQRCGAVLKQVGDLLVSIKED